jgi:superfamily II DNA or RNA helicase/diadenosine tetraphosphate (Ap4A) HIT family hydrolase/HKD family nuclease
VAQCPFCYPSPDRVFHTGSLVLGLWDGYPVSPGHALLVPKRHIATWAEATPEEQLELMQAIGIAQQASPGADGFNVGMNLGSAAGQTVPHLHLHVIPRYHGDVPDPRGGVRHVLPEKANYWLGLPHSAPLISGESDPLGPHLAAYLEHAQRADMAVAFIQVSGLERLWPDLERLLEREGQLRIVTGDYLGVTDPDALQRLLVLRERHPEQIRLLVFEARQQAFHPKAYLFTDALGRMTSLVGSSNLSESALGSGLEWNGRQGGDYAVQAFERLLEHPSVVELTAEWLAAYRARRPAPVLLGGASLAGEGEQRVTQTAPLESAPVYHPNGIQREALEALESTRAEGNQAGLVVLATGLGKTYLAAFDSRAFQRILFVAHRNEILNQASNSFARVRPQAHIGFYHGEQKDPGAQILFANIATLQNHLERFAPDAFDYLIVDEFHHAASAGYRKVIDYFRPRFFLGLTATPERTDGGDLLGLCLQNLVYRCDLVRGIGDKLLCPFRYFGVPDLVDYTNIPWRSGRFDPEALDQALAAEARAENAYEHYRALAQSRTIAFCCSQRHADYMGEFFRSKGLRVAVVHSGPHSDGRAESVRRLSEGELDLLCCVDMFNEGLDVPQIDTVMMLRPTESKVIWLQQLGRGLRVHPGKTHLSVIDYIGNHRSFLQKPQLIFEMAGRSLALRKALERLRQGTLTEGLPFGCEVTYDPAAIELLEAFVRTRPTNALDAFVAEFTELHGRRPLALEAYQARVNPGAARLSHGSWIGYVGEAVSEGEREFLAHLERTEMTKSYKIVLLQAMIGLGAFPGSVSIDELTREFARLVARSARLRADLSEDVDDLAAVRRLVVKNPVAAWAGGAYFAYEGGVFRSLVEVRAELALEIADWCLARYLDRSRGAICKLIQASGKPIVKLSDKYRAQLPSGPTPLWADGVEYEADFVKLFLNVIRPVGGGANVLPDVLRGWFGETAGANGSRHEVQFEQRDGRWVMEPAP